MTVRLLSAFVIGVSALSYSHRLIYIAKNGVVVQVGTCIHAYKNSNRNCATDANSKDASQAYSCKHIK
jgi:hypothetical protein